MKARYVVASCDAALTSTIVTADDNAKIHTWRQYAEHFAISRDACRSGEIAACEAGLASPAANETDRKLLAQWRDEASPLYRARAAVSGTWMAASTSGGAFIKSIDD